MKPAWRISAVMLGLASLLLMAAYSAVVPAFEAPDEPGHFGYVLRLASGQGLPVQGERGNYDPELSQPPLYYALEAVVAQLIPTTGAELPDLSRQNVYQNTTPRGNVNLYSHPSIEDFPWTGRVLQLHAMRLLNVMFAAATLLATYGIGRLAGLSPAAALAAAGTLGLLPQFDFIAGALNADNAIAASSSVALLLLLRWLNRPPELSGAVLLGLATSAAMLSKLSGPAVLLFVLAAMIWRLWRERDGRAARQTALVAAISLVLGGWWYGRNLALYGDVLSWQPMLTAIGAMLRPHPLSPLAAGWVLLQQWPTAIGVFGWSNLRLPPAAYYGVAALALAGVLGFCHAERSEASVPWARMPRFARHDKGFSARLLILLAWFALFAAGLVRWVEVNTDAAQWRLLLPAFPALAVLVAAGWARIARLLVAILPVSLGALSAAGLLLVVRPAYTPDSPYRGPIQHQLAVRFGDRLELVGYDDPRLPNPAPGQPVALTLYWRALQPLDRDEVVDLAAVDFQAQPGLKQSTWPQDGRAPTTRWASGQIVRDEHLLSASERLQPGVWTFQLDVFQPLPRAPRLPVTGGGTTVDVGRFLVLPPQPGAPPVPVAAFEGGLALVGHVETRAAGHLDVRLQWQVTGPVERDYTVFVHLLDAEGRLVAQNDSQPGAGRFPTSLLPPGATVDDLHSIDVGALPPSGCQLELGLYDAQTGSRLKLLGQNADALRLPLKLG